jgi:ribosomal protein S18 acetylase RimI-like enzyme
MQHAIEQEALAIRPLGRDDLAAVVAIDTAIEGRSRRTYIERRLAAALREPALHAQFAACDQAGLAGYILARVLQGEFGRSETALRLELVGVRQDARRHKAGSQLLDALVQWAARREIRSLRTSAYWGNAQMLGWLGAMGFQLAPEVMLGLPLAQAPQADEPEAALEGSPEVNFGAPEGNDHERMARGSVEIRPMAKADLPQILRIDRAVSGRDRAGYIEARLAEAMEDSAIRISLAGRIAGAIVCFAMARADLGDFGRTQPVAVLDTIGVDPEYAHRGLGRALVTRVCSDAAQLQARRVETLVRVADLDLLGFFQRAGFTPSQRLSFVRELRPAAS